MNDAFTSLQELLRAPDPDYTHFRMKLLQMQGSLSGLESIRCTMILRLGIALEDFEEHQAGTADILVLLRQIIRAYSQRLDIHISLWSKLEPTAHTFGIYTTDVVTPDSCEIMAKPWTPSWLAHAENIDKLESRRSDQPAIGDGLIAALSNGAFTTYQSEAQKIAVQECLFAPPGSTLLVTLPTGAGKSLCIQLPAWQKSQGGRIKGGTTLVVVPTVSLALDQEERGKRLFSQAFGHEYTPCSLTGVTPEPIRAAIYRGIEQGTLPILFTSPESLMTTSLYHVCLEASRRGTINQLVIDEAHLIETWGAGFRTEFQFLAAYRKKLLETSEGQLRTLLLSATISTSCEKLLKRLFSSSSTFYSLRADRLRPEIAYWFNQANTKEHRQSHVLEALRYLPRPAIIYVTSPDDTKQWVRDLKEQGFRRLAAFSGETPSDERLRLIKAWNENQYDIMLATSAFGVGVDKSDVRTIIHASLPENIDRFYQEVGRAGRDGYSAISLTCLAEGDLDKAKAMNRTARITTQKAIPRWEGMWMTRRATDYSDIILVDTNATPSEKQEMYKGPSNREWNEHTLLLMQRARLIEITEMRDDLTEEEQERDTQQENISDDNAMWLHIKLLQPYIVSFPRNTEFTEWFEKVRDLETSAIQQSLDRMRKVASKYSGNEVKHCLTHSFAQVYTRSTHSCGGCPYCRAMQQAPYAGILELEREGEVDLSAKSSSIPPKLLDICGQRQRVSIILEEPSVLKDVLHLPATLIQLIDIGFQQLIIPDELINDRNWTDALIRELKEHTKKPHVILPMTWVSDEDDKPIYRVPTIAIYPNDDEAADHFHKTFRHLERTRLQDIPVLMIARRNLMLRSEQGTFLNRINTLSYNLDQLKNRLSDPDELVL